MSRWPLLLLLALVGAPAAHAAATYAFVACTDFSSGCASWVSLGPPRTPHACVTALSSDPVARWAFGKVYVVNRFGFDNVQVLDPGNGFATERQFSVGNGSNPQDIAVITPAKAYVSRLGSSSLLIVNPSNGATLGTISLAAFADADGLPEAHKMLLYGDRVFVSLQRLENFAPAGLSYLAVIDTRTDQVVGSVTLTGTNPNTDLVYDAAADRILVGETGEFGALDGGIERVNPHTLTALGFETTEAQLGGDLNDLALAPNGRAYAVISDASFHTKLVRYDRVTGAVVKTLFNPGSFAIADVEANDRGELWVCDQSFASPGLRVYATANDSLVAGPIAVGLPPFDLAFDAAQVVDAGPEPSPGLRLLAAGPNPAREAFAVRYRADGAGDVTRLRIYDARGAALATLESAAASGTLSWRAATAASGVYYYRLEQGGRSITGSFVRLR